MNEKNKFKDKEWNMALTHFGKKLLQSPCANNLCGNFDFLLNLLFNSYNLNSKHAQFFKQKCKNCGKEMELIEVPYCSTNKFFFVFECSCGCLDCVPKEQMIKFLEQEQDLK